MDFINVRDFRKVSALGRYVRFKTALLLLVLVIGSGVATSQASETDSTLSIYAGFCIYADPVYDSVSLLEFSFALKRNEFSFFKVDSVSTLLNARVFAQLDLFNPQGKAIDSASTYFSLRANSQAEADIPDIRIFNNVSLFVSPGVYSARLTVYDVHSKFRGEYFVDHIEALPIEKEELSIGGYCLAYEIASATDAEASSRLVKNGYRIYPNPISIFSTDDSILFLYSEVYNLPSPEVSGAQFEVDYVLLNRDSAYLRDLGHRSASSGDGTGLIVESFDIKGWPPAVYNLQVVVSDPGSAQVDTAVIPFGIMSPVGYQSDSRLTAEDDPYLDLDPEECISLVAYLLTPEQQGTLKRLSETGKKNYLNQYWRENDPNPVTAVNESRMEMLERFEFVNRRFSTNEERTDGWSTDRGRIYMTYGLFDEVDDVSSPRFGNPYLVWHYRRLDEGKMFVFEDWAGSFDYRLVHSNVYGEVFDQRWDEFLIKGQQLDVE